MFALEYLREVKYCDLWNLNFETFVIILSRTIDELGVQSSTEKWIPRDQKNKIPQDNRV